MRWEGKLLIFIFKLSAIDQVNKVADSFLALTRHDLLLFLAKLYNVPCKEEEKADPIVKRGRLECLLHDTYQIVIEIDARHLSFLTYRFNEGKVL